MALLLAKLRAKGINGSLLTLLEDYLQGRTFWVVVSGRASAPANIEASVPQGSILGSVLWNIYIDDLLRQLPGTKTYADDSNISLSYCRQDSQRAIAVVNSCNGSGGVGEGVAGQLHV
uniref:Reverse transcriptase domain-containing protein n=1 Tax=Scylla olivacea TaxID=85551 RepID=A0A0P4VU38_SCYOL